MGEPMVIYKPEMNSGKKSLKRKRALLVEGLSKEERESQLGAMREELNGLYKYFKEVLEEKKNMGLDLCTSVNSVIGCLLEGNSLPLSKLVTEIYEIVKDREGSVSLASVRSSVLLIGQRSFYGLPNADADVLEDDSESSLWCWETRDVKLIPKSIRGALKIWRACRKKISERITAVSAMITALQKSESDLTCRQELIKSLERLGKVSSEADIRLSIGNMVQKNGADMAEKEGKRDKKQMERNKREAEKERKRFDMELQKEKLQSEKELKRLQDEAEKEEKRREKEESESWKQLKRKQEELEKDQRRREKEEAEQKKQLALQKQVSLMECFLNKSKNSSPSQKDPSPAKMESTDSSCNKSTVTLSMDWALSQFDETNTENIWKSHLNSWRHLGHSIRSNGKQHWGIRWMPKTELVKELKLTTSRQPHRDDELGLEKLVDEWDETDSDCRQCYTNADISLRTGPKCNRRKQLLQFDKSHRPAFCGNWPKKSQVIGPRHPFVKDPDLDYEIDSDEEWEEEEPGESLSDCDKDDEEESLEEGPSKAEDEDESDDGFFVPDGYLSENEGVQEDRMECENSVEEARSSPSCKQVESEELCVFIRQQKHLHNLTERALRKNRPLIISNLMHEKVPLILTEDLIGTPELEQTCLLALSMRAFPGCPSIEISVSDDVQEENLEASPSSYKGNTMPVATSTAILDSDLPQIVSVIQSSTQGINKVVESLQIKFPTISKTQLRNKVREISDFTDNRWQVKKYILDMLGLSPSPEKSGLKMKNIAAFFSKRCLPPARKAQNPNETSPQSSHKPDSAASELHRIIGS